MSQCFGRILSSATMQQWLSLTAFNHFPTPASTQWMLEPDDMARGQELVCSDQALKETFTEADLVSLYRFSFEIERARNRLDLNVGAADITGDHVVPNHIHPNRSEPRLGPVNQPE
ncbi:hypothetical protein YC2023_118620 [Brassica napus]